MEDSDIGGFSSRSDGCTTTTTSEFSPNDDIVVNGDVVISTNNTTSIVNRTPESATPKGGQSGGILPPQQQQISSSSPPGGKGGGGNHHHSPRKTTAASINIGGGGGGDGRRGSRSQHQQEKEKEGTFLEAAGTEETQGPLIETLETEAAATTTTTKAAAGAPPGVVVRRVSRKTRRRRISESDNNNITGTNSQSEEDVVTAVNATLTESTDMMMNSNNSPSSSSSKNAAIPRRGSRRRRTRLDSGGGGGETASPTTILAVGKKSPRRGSTGILKNTSEFETNIQPTAGKSSVAPPPPPPPLTTTGQSTAATETTPDPAAAAAAAAATTTLSETPIMTNIKAARRKSTGILKDTSLLGTISKPATTDSATTMPSDDVRRVPTRRGSVQEGGLKQLSGGGGGGATKTVSQSSMLSRDNNSSSKKRIRKVRAPTLDELLDHELQDDMIELLGHGPLRFGPAIIPPEITPMQVRQFLAEGSGNQLGDYVKLRLRLESKRKKSGNKNEDADNTKKKKSSSLSSSLAPASPYSSPPNYSLESISNFTDAQLLRFVQFCHSRDPNYYWMISNSSSRGGPALSSGDRAYKLLKNCKPYYFHLTAFDAQNLIQDDLILVPIPKLQLLKELPTNPNSTSSPAAPTLSPTLLRSPSDYTSETFQERYLNSRILYFRPSRFFPKKSHKADIVDTLVYILDHWTQTDTVLLGKHNFTHPQPVIYAMLVDLQDFDPSYNYTKDYWMKFMAVLQGKIFPVQISVVLWVDPPSSFQHKIWSTTKQMMATSEFASRNYLLTRQELGLYLQTNYQEFLPVDVYYDICYQAGSNVDNPSQSLQHMANDYVTFEKYLETIQGKTSIMNLLKKKKEEAQKRGRGRGRRFSMPKKLPKSLKKLPGTRGRSKSRSRKQQKSNKSSKSPDRNDEEENQGVLDTSYRQEDSNSNVYGEEDLAAIFPGEESEPEGGSDVEPSKERSRSLSVGRLRKRINKRREKRKEKKEQKKAEKERKKQLNGRDDNIPVQSEREGDEEDSVSSSSQPSVNASSTQPQDSSSRQRRSSQPNISPALSPEHRRRVGGGVFGGRPVLHKNQRRSSMSVLEELQHEGSTGVFLAATTTTPTGAIRRMGDHDSGGIVNKGAREGNIDNVDEKGYNDSSDNVAPSLQKEKSIYVDEFLLRDDKQQPEHKIPSPNTPKRNRRRRLSLKTLMSPLKSPLKPLKKLGHRGGKYSPRSDSQQGGGDGSSSVVSRSNSMMSDSHHGSFHGQEVFEQSFAVSQLVSPSSQKSSPNNTNSAPNIVRTPPTPSQRRRYSSTSYQNRTPNNNSSSGDKLYLGASSDGSGMNFFDSPYRHIDSDESQRSGNNYFDDSLQQSPNYFEDSLQSPNDSNYNASNRKPREGKESYDWDTILKDAKDNNAGGSSYRRLSPQVVKKQTIQQQLELQQLQKSVPIMRPTRRHSAGAFDMIQPPPLSGMSESHNATATTTVAPTDPSVNHTTGSPSNVKKKQQDLEYFREQVERQKEKTRRLQQQRYSNASSTSTERATKTGGN